MISLSLFFFNDTATTEIYTLSLHDALPISGGVRRARAVLLRGRLSRLATALRGGPLGPGGSSSGGPVVPGCLRSEEHTSELQSLAYLVCRLLLEKKKKTK